MPDNPSNTRIKKLSPLLINQLAAGEVVTRPAAVAKELLENAIDAGASNIEIHITQGGMGMIEVVDNGVGIHPDDMVMAITRHATSKVADVANLHGIRTLGFRGEALAATAAVSRLTLTSSHDDSGIGCQLQVAGILDDMPKLIPVVHHRGTTITVKDLYFNVPARRGNLKSIATEFGHIETIVREVALARADVALTLFHDNKKRLSLSSRSIDNSNKNNGSRLPLSRLEQATGSSLADNALEIMIDLGSLMSSPKEYSNGFSDQASITGWLWPITDSQNTLPKLIYVNGRLVKEPLINNQLRQLAQSAQLASIGYALYFDLPVEWLNINVHPSKQRIKISPLNNIMAHLSHAIQSKLKNIAVNEQIAKNDNSQVESDISISTSPISQQTLKMVLAGEPYESYLSPQRNALKNRQVSELKQPYRLSEQSYSSEHLYEAQSSEVDGFTEDTCQDAASTNKVSDPNKRVIKSAILPYCLDVIYPDCINNLDSSLDGLTVDSTVIKGIEGATLPWLLFYNQGKYLLISEADWYSKISSLFESQVLNNQLLSKQVLSNQILSHNASKKGRMLDSAAYINQQLATVNAQMTEQDLMVFVADIESLLINNAVKIIDSHQLVALMLSSKNEQNN